MNNVLKWPKPRLALVARRSAGVGELITRGGRERRLLRLARRLDDDRLRLLLHMAARLAAETRAPPPR